MEAKLQSKIIKWLRDQGAYVLKPRGGPGIPVGCPDIIALFGWKWLAIEVKADAKAPFRVGQEATIKHLSKGNINVYVAHPGNWPDIQRQIKDRFF
jgi:Holliday junction resolvase